MPWQKYYAAKGSNLPPLELLSELAPWFPKTMILADYEDEPAHPVENGRMVAEALGAEFHSVNTRAEREAQWPGIVAEFVERVKEEFVGDETGYAGKVVKSVVSGEASVSGKSVSKTDSKTESKKYLRRLLSLSSIPKEGDAYDDASKKLLLTEAQLRTSSQLCVGDYGATPTLEQQCLSLTVSESRVYEEERASRIQKEMAASAEMQVTGKQSGSESSVSESTPIPVPAFNPFYLRTGLDVDECEESGLGVVR